MNQPEQLSAEELKAACERLLNDGAYNSAEFPAIARAYLVQAEELAERREECNAYHATLDHIRSSLEAGAWESVCAAAFRVSEKLKQQSEEIDRLNAELYSVRKILFETNGEKSAQSEVLREAEEALEMRVGYSYRSIRNKDIDHECTLKERVALARIRALKEGK